MRTREEINGQITILTYQLRILENELYSQSGVDAPTACDLSRRIEKLKAQIQVLVTERNYAPRSV